MLNLTVIILGEESLAFIVSVLAQCARDGRGFQEEAGAGNPPIATRKEGKK